MKKLAFLLIIVGLIFVGFGGYQYVKTQAAEKQSLNQAKAMLGKDTTKKDTADLTAKSYAPNQGETIGILTIPSINAELPIVEGTDPDELEKGVGHYNGSAFPLQNDQIVLSGHRDTVFRGLGDVKIGDKLIVTLPYGEFTYEMVDSQIVDAEDRTIIKSTAPNEELILTTCYPFSFIGDAPERYIITAIPIN
ncbi:class D sortase [Aquibacillus halophilus]|uniref:Class D sortase n=1 Tax=Aquibacillus halophilus TaxID=930132 RepID=A0A6A8DGE5_9BACI|nr:class D sortase [Aquibacillus halophilus]MRH41957.1 class D sortase [Aquibacillus halophilus]